MNDSLRRYACAALIACALASSCVATAYAVNASAFLAGTVTNGGVSAAHVTVTASGNNLTVKTTTDARGRFSFPPLALGTYDVEARDGDLRGLVRVDLGSGGASITIALEKLTEIAHAVVSQSQSLTTHGSGSDVVLNSTALTRLPFDNSFTQMETQMPGAAQGANGVVHINGDHGVINYMLDGVPLPQELNRDIGSEINLNDLSFVDLIEGAYPAQYGLKFGCGFQYVDASRYGPARLRRICVVRFVHRRPVDDRVSRAARRRRGLRRRAQRPHDHAGPRSARFQLAAQRCELGRVSSRASRSPPVATTSRTLRSSIATTRFRFPTTSPTANRRYRRQRDASRYVPVGPVPPRDREYRRDHVGPGIQRIEDPGLRRSDERLALRRVPQPDAAAVWQRRHVDGLRQCVRRRPDEPDGLPDDVRLIARRSADGARLHHAG